MVGEARCLDHRNQYARRGQEGGAGAEIKIGQPLQMSSSGSGTKWVCHECGEQQDSKNALNGHMNRHSKIKCRLCDKTFGQRNSYRVHLKAEHPKHYKCRRCVELGVEPYIDADPYRVIYHVLNHDLLKIAADFVYQYVEEV